MRPLHSVASTNMEIQSVSYHKTFNLGNYSNEKIGIDIKVSPGDDPVKVFSEAKKIVEKSHHFFRDMPKYEEAKVVVANPMTYTGRQVEVAKEVIKAFEENYPDYINQFIPVSRQLDSMENRMDELDF